MADKSNDKQATEAKAGDKKAAAKKGANAKKGADKKKGGKRSAGDGVVSVAANPRAVAGVKRAKGWGGIAGFAIAAYLGYKANVPPDQLGLRALAAGVAGYMLLWACAVAVWRHILLAELRMLVETKRPAPMRTIAATAEPSAGNGGPAPSEPAALGPAPATE
jgi:hypothetical protein